MRHSAEECQRSKSKLETKLHETPRRLHLYIWKEFGPICCGNALEVTIIIILRSLQQCHNLGTKSLYVKLQRKQPEAKIASYHRRRIFENNQLESVKILRDWISQEAEVQVVTAEAIDGIKLNSRKKKSYNETYFTNK